MIRFASLGSGSAGNALLVESGGACLMVDCGFGLRETVGRMLRLDQHPADLDGILVTHEHGDHVGGVFRLARKYGLPVWMTHGTWVACCESADALDLRIIDAHRPFSAGAFEIQPFPVPHDAREPVQYVLSSAGRRLAVLTDIGELTPHVCASVSGCDGLVLEFNHDADRLAGSGYPASVKRRVAGRLGHLDNRAALALLGQIDCSRLQHLIAAHLSERNNCGSIVRGLLADYVPLACSESGVTVATQKYGFDWRSLI